MKKLVPLTILLLLLAACVPIGSIDIPPVATPATTPVAPQSLAGTEWALVSIDGPDGATPAHEGATVTLEFDENGQVSGSGGCNSYGGTYEVQDNRLSFGEITRTLMACVDENVMAQEEAYFTALQSAGEFDLSGEQLTLWYGEGEGTLIFQQAEGGSATPESDIPAATPTAEEESAALHRS